MFAQVSNALIPRTDVKGFYVGREDKHIPIYTVPEIIAVLNHKDNRKLRTVQIKFLSVPLNGLLSLISTPFKSKPKRDG